jgi:glycosyltransferase involved in cell wall biosynthesis
MTIKLSILVPTVPNRIDNFYLRLMKDLINQTKDYSNVELISFFDNKKISIGKKRNEMLRLANGEYLVFIDDDDRISPDYVSEIMKALEANPGTDCVVFDNICSVNSGTPYVCKYGIEFEYKGPVNGLWTGKPAHTMVYKSEIAKRYNYTDMGAGEDMDWVKRAWKDIVRQTRIDKVLYYYDAEPNTTTETQNNNLTQTQIRQNIINKFHLTA